MKAEDFGRSLPRGIGVNLLVSDMAAMVAFCGDVLGARIVYADEDFAAIELLGSVFMLHADHSYLDNPMTGSIAGAETRGAGIELRLHGAEPDAIEGGGAGAWPHRAGRRDRQAAWSARVLYRRTGRICVRAECAARRVSATNLQRFIPQTLF
ncbi:VOC family protein [Mesorhizobium australicum]|uniref:VOC family protein n=1 Tax=Mesorhizobium australicum TaxID=536018 RepID=UPI003335FD21